MSNLHLIPKKRLHITDISTKAATRTSQAFLFVCLVGLIFVADSIVITCSSCVLVRCGGTSRNVWDAWLVVCGPPLLPPKRFIPKVCEEPFHRGLRGQKLLKEKVTVPSALQRTSHFIFYVFLDVVFFLKKKKNLYFHLCFTYSRIKLVFICGTQ